MDGLAPRLATSPAPGRQAFVSHSAQDETVVGKLPHSFDTSHSTVS
jgi:hypothetical protein